MPRPITWLIGMKLSVIDGSALRRRSQWPARLCASMLATRRSVYMAPFGAPVLPEV